MNGYIKVSAAANAAPAVRDWSKEIRRYSADPTATQTLDALATLVTAKVHATAAPIYDNLAVKSATSREVVVQACMDTSKEALADANGKPVKLRPLPHPRMMWTFNTYLYDPKYGGWLVRDTVASNPARTC